MIVLGGLERSAFAPFMVPFFSPADWAIVIAVSLSAHGVLRGFVWLHRKVNKS